MTLRRRILVIGHDHVAGLGHLGEELERVNVSLEPVTVVPEASFDRPNVSFNYPDPRDWDGIITLGAPWPRDQISRWWPQEVDFLRAAFETKVPILGICFGGQLLAEALGGGVRPLESTRLGWTTVHSAASNEYGGLWFQWHSDQIVSPPRALILATSADGCEAFGIGSAVGIQYHPEINLALLRGWMSVSGSRIGAVRSDGLLRETAAQEHRGLRERVRKLTMTIFDSMF